MLVRYLLHTNAEFNLWHPNKKARHGGMCLTLELERQKEAALVLAGQ